MKHKVLMSFSSGSGSVVSFKDGKEETSWAVRNEPPGSSFQVSSV